MLTASGLGTGMMISSPDDTGGSCAALVVMIDRARLLRTARG